MHLSYLAIHMQVDIMRSWSLALTLVAVLLLAVVLLVMVRPPVYAVQKSKEGSCILASNLNVQNLDNISIR